MRRSMKAGLAVALLGLALAAGTAYGDALKKTIDVYVGGITLVVDGRTVATEKEPFLYNGTTYVPLRAVADALGKPVAWDGENNRVIIGSDPAITAQLGTLPLADWQWSEGAESKTLQLGGVSVSPALWLRSSPWKERSAQATWALGGRFKTLDGQVGVPDGGFTSEATVSLVGNGKVLAELRFVPGTPPQRFQVDVTGVQDLQLRVQRLTDTYAEFAVVGTLAP